jgi:hypothetical protein
MRIERLAALVGAVAVIAGLLIGGAYIPGRVSDAQDFLADVCAALATGALLFMQRKTACAESSPQ